MPEEALPLPGDKRPRKVGTVGQYWRLSGGFWRGVTARRAWLLTLATIGLVMANIGVQYGINRWNAFFFDSLEKKQSNIVLSAIGLFAVLAVASSAITVFQLIARMRLQVYWRQWLTERLASRWLDDQRFYRLSIAAPDLDALEFRIADDARIATEPVVDFGSGIMNAVLTAVVFFGVLWSVGGNATVFGIELPGFMVFAAIAYSVVMSGSMLLFGRPLITCIEAKNSAEARLRTEMAHVRENAESIALIGGEADETQGLRLTLQALVDAWMRQISQLARMTWLMGSNWAVAPVFPLLLEAPNYLAGSLTLGALMQTAAAFVQVQVALNWLFDNYPRIAEWLASAGRVTGLWAAFSQLDASVGTGAEDRIMIGDSPDGTVRLEGLSVAQFNGRVMIDEADTAIEHGEKVLLTGESGTGKSTLIRAIAGLWPWGSGRVLLPKGARVAFLPQRAYIPHGTLRQVLQYPVAGAEMPDAVLRAALERCGLQHFSLRLDDEDRWDKQLSGGEQQRVGFARLVIQRPDIVIMDEATAALDVGSLSEIDVERRHSLGRLLRHTLRPRATPDPSHPIAS